MCRCLSFFLYGLNFLEYECGVLKLIIILAVRWYPFELYPNMEWHGESVHTIAPPLWSDVIFANTSLVNNNERALSNFKYYDLCHYI